MGVAAMVIGIISSLLAFIPMCGFFAFAPAALGLILGIIDVALKSKKKLPKGQGIAGIVLNVVALGLIVLQTVVFAAAAVASEEALNEVAQEIEAYE